MNSAIDRCLDDLRKAFDDIDHWVHVPFFEFLVSIPEGNENDLYDLAGKYSAAAQLHASHAHDVATHLNDLYTGWSGDGAAQAAGDSLQQYMQQLSGMTDALNDMEKLVNGGAQDIESTKYMAILNLVFLLITLIQVIMTLIVSFGATAAEGAGAIALCKQLLADGLKALLTKLRNVTVKAVVKVALKRGVQFAAFTALSKGGIYLIQTAEGHDPTWDWKSFTGEMVDSFATGFIGGPLSVGLHGPIGEGLAMGGGQLGDNAFRWVRGEAFGNDQWAQDLGLSVNPNDVHLMDGVAQGMLFGSVMAGGESLKELPDRLGSARAGLDLRQLGTMLDDAPELSPSDLVPVEDLTAAHGPGSGLGMDDAPRGSGSLGDGSAPSGETSDAGPGGNAGADRNTGTGGNAGADGRTGSGGGDSKPPAATAGTSHGDRPGTTDGPPRQRSADDTPQAQRTTDGTPQSQRPADDVRANGDPSGAGGRSGTADAPGGDHSATGDDRSSTTGAPGDDHSATGDAPGRDDHSTAADPRGGDHSANGDAPGDRSHAGAADGHASMNGSGHADPASDGSRTTGGSGHDDSGSNGVGHERSGHDDGSGRSDGSDSPARTGTNHDVGSDPTRTGAPHDGRTAGDNRAAGTAPREQPRWHEWKQRYDHRIADGYGRRMAEEFLGKDGKQPLTLSHDMVDRVLGHRPEDLSAFGRRLRSFVEDHLTTTGEDGLPIAMDDAAIRATLSDLGSFGDKPAATIPRARTSADDIDGAADRDGTAGHDATRGDDAAEPDDSAGGDALDHADAVDHDAIADDATADHDATSHRDAPVASDRDGGAADADEEQWADAAAGPAIGEKVEHGRQLFGDVLDHQFGSGDWDPRSDATVHAVTRMVQRMLDTPGSALRRAHEGKLLRDFLEGHLVTLTDENKAVPLDTEAMRTKLDELYRDVPEPTVTGITHDVRITDADHAPLAAEPPHDGVARTGSPEPHDHPRPEPTGPVTVDPDPWQVKRVYLDHDATATQTAKIAYDTLDRYRHVLEFERFRLDDPADIHTPEARAATVDAARMLADGLHERHVAALHEWLTTNKRPDETEMVRIGQTATSVMLRDGTLVAASSVREVRAETSIRSLRRNEPMPEDLDPPTSQTSEFTHWAIADVYDAIPERMRSMFQGHCGESSVLSHVAAQLEKPFERDYLQRAGVATRSELTPEQLTGLRTDFAAHLRDQLDGGNIVSVFVGGDRHGAEEFPCASDDLLIDHFGLHTEYIDRISSEAYVDADAGVISFVPEGTALRHNAATLASAHEDWLVVVVHGHLEPKDFSATYGHDSLGHVEVARLIKRITDSDGALRSRTKIVLISCDSASTFHAPKIGETTFAKQLANRLSTEVVAPPDRAWISSHGRLSLGATPNRTITSESVGSGRADPWIHTDQTGAAEATGIDTLIRRNAARPADGAPESWTIAHRDSDGDPLSMDNSPSDDHASWTPDEDPRAPDDGSEPVAVAPDSDQPAAGPSVPDDDRPPPDESLPPFTDEHPSSSAAPVSSDDDLSTLPDAHRDEQPAAVPPEDPRPADPQGAEARTDDPQRSEPALPEEIAYTEDAAHPEAAPHPEAVARPEDTVHPEDASRAAEDRPLADDQRDVGRVDTNQDDADKHDANQPVRTDRDPDDRQPTTDDRQSTEHNAGGPGQPAGRDAAEHRDPATAGDEADHLPDYSNFVLRDWHSKFPETLAPDDPLLRSTHLIDTPERREWRDEVVRKALTGAEPVTDGKPIMYLMGGGGASGKGTLLKRLVHDGIVPERNVVNLDPDEIKAETIPEYREIVLRGDSRAAAVAHEESSDLGKRILREAQEKKLNIVYDVTLGDPRKAIAMIGHAKEAGYEIRLYGVSADGGRAVDWNLGRAKKSGRWVPIKMQLTAHRGFSRGFAAYADLVDSAELYDTNGGRPSIMAVKFPGRPLEIVDQDRYDAFLHKADIDPGAAGQADLFTEPHRIEPPATAPDREHYVDRAMANLSRTSRTAAGTIDTTASAGKADQMAADLSGDRAARLAQENYRSVVASLYDDRHLRFADPAELRSFVEHVVTRVNTGILRDGVLYREHDSEKYPSYTRVADLPRATTRFFDELYRRLNDPATDPIETAAWVEYRMDMTDHLWADGCGKSAKAIAAWVLMRSGHDLPAYPAERAAQFAHAPTLPTATGPRVDAVQLRDWLDYYRSLFKDSLLKDVS